MTLYDDLIWEVATGHGLRYDLLQAQVVVESGGDRFAFRYEQKYFDRYIRNNTQAKGYDYGPVAGCSFGLLQIVYETALEQGFTDRPETLFVPKVGLNAGARCMSLLLQWASGDYMRALAAYNGGKGGNVIPPFRNQHYADKVYSQAGNGKHLA